MGYDTSDFDIKENNIHDILPDLRKKDFVFIALHGTFGEDGSIQKILEESKINYNGSSFLSSELCFDKHKAKMVVDSLGDNTPAWRCFDNLSELYPDMTYDDLYYKITKPKGDELKFRGFDLSSKLVIKPNKQGSSIGFNIVENFQSLWSVQNHSIKNPLTSSFDHDDSVIVEEYIEGREITVSILGEDSLPIVEIQPSNDVYDYEAKYTRGASNYICPANLNQSLSNGIRRTALKIHQLMGCSVYSRVDFRLDKDNNFWFLEINTLPGMTETSLFPMAANIVGLSFEDLIDKIIKLSLEK